MATWLDVIAESGVGAYGFRWHWALQYLPDHTGPCRFRWIAGGFRWCGNQGGYHESRPRYFTGRVAADILRRYADEAYMPGTLKTGYRDDDGEDVYNDRVAWLRDIPEIVAEYWGH